MNKSELMRQLLQASPFLSFRKEELEKIEARYHSRKNIFARFGYQWTDQHGESRKNLSIALRDSLRQLLGEVTKSIPDCRYELNYSSLRAQAGRPVLNKIVFDILSGDLLFFDISHLNANVFFELGIAYATNTNLFLLRQEGVKQQVPSDLSGLTHCSYHFDGKLILNSSSQSDIKAVMKKLIVQKMNANVRG
jgi:hypothetical protein